MGSTALPLPPVPPGTQSPDVANAVPDVNRTVGERALGGIGGVLAAGTGQDFSQTALGQTLTRHHETRLATARRHYDNAATLAGALSQGDVDPTTGEPTGINPSTQQPMTPQERQQYKDMHDGAFADYAKIAGVNPDAKQAVDRQKGILQFAITKGHQALQKIIGAHQQAATAAGQPAPGTTPPPPPSAGGVPNAGTTTPPPTPSATATMATGANAAASGGLPSPPPANPLPAAGPAAPPPPAAPSPTTQPIPSRPGAYSETAQEAMPLMREDLATYQAAKHAALGGAEGPVAIAQRKRNAEVIGLTPGTREYNQYIAVGTFPIARGMQLKQAINPATGDVVPAQYDPYSGSIVGADGDPLPSGYRVATPAEVSATSIPHQIGYKGPNGDHLIGYRVGEHLYDQQMHPLPADTQDFDAGLVPKTTTGTTQHIDPVTGKVETLQSGHTTAPGRGRLPAPPSASSSAAAPSPDDAAREAAYAARQARQNITGTTRTMIETAPRVQALAARVRQLVTEQQATLGPAASRWQEFMAGKVGAPNPGFTALRTDVGLLQTLLMRMHVGARGGGEMMEHFKGMLDSGTQSSANLLSALDEIDAYAKDVAAEGGPALPTATATAAPATAATPNAKAPPPKPKPTNAADYLKSIGASQ